MTGLEYLEPGAWARYSLAAITSSVHRYLTSGCAAETLLLLTGPPHHWSIPKLTLIAILNICWGLAATSWLFHIIFVVVCWPLVLATSALQYAAVSKLTRKWCRKIWKNAHFSKDRVAWFGIPSLKLDINISGLVTIRGVTFSLLDLVLELHGIEISMDLGSGHELCILSDGITMRLFREILVGEVCGVHWLNGSSEHAEPGGNRRDSHLDDRAPSMTEDAEQVGDSPPTASKRDMVKDKISQVVSSDDQTDAPVDHAPGATTGDREAPDEEIRGQKVEAALARNDLEADERYEHALAELQRTNRLSQSREQVKRARKESTAEMNEQTALRHAVCAGLRTTKATQSGTAGEIALTRLMELFEPISRFLDRVPIALRLVLWLLTQSHAISCPSICFTAAGPFLGGALLDQLFRDHATEDSRIKRFKSEVSAWLCAANLYAEFDNITAQSSVPVLTTNNITCDLRSKGIYFSRIGGDMDNSGRVAELHGMDCSFSIPTCLLTSHSYVKPPPESPEEPDTAPVTMSVRASLPASFSEATMRFAATLAKTSQMLDIEEEAGQATQSQSTSTDPRNPLTKGRSCSCEDDNEDEECAVHVYPRHGRLRAAIKHPMQQAKQTLHKEVKRTAVDNVDGAWFIKWMNKGLRQMESMDGDVGYTHDIPVSITRPGGGAASI